MQKKMSKKVYVKFLFMNHWGHFEFLPRITMSVVYNQPKIMIAWLVFRVDFEFYHRLSDWFMKYIWRIMMFDFLKKKKDE